MSLIVAMNVVGALSGLSMAAWPLYGDTLEEAVARARLVRQVAYAVVGALLYWRLVAPLPCRWLSHALATFALTLAIDFVVATVLFRLPPTQYFEPGALLRGMGAMTAGLSIAWAFARRRI